MASAAGETVTSPAASTAGAAVLGRPPARSSIRAEPRRRPRRSETRPIRVSSAETSEVAEECFSPESGDRPDVTIVSQKAKFQQLALEILHSGRAASLGDAPLMSGPPAPARPTGEGHRAADALGDRYRDPANRDAYRRSAGIGGAEPTAMARARPDDRRVVRNRTRRVRNSADAPYSCRRGD